MSSGSVESERMNSAAEQGPAERAPPERPEATAAPRLCRRCGARLADSYVEGVCPRCLMGCALDETLPEPPKLDGRPTTPERGRLPERFGRYRVERLIGRGAMGDVYLAHDQELKRPVAIKTPQLTRANDPTMLERFRREARLAAALQHPNICPVYDVGEVDGTLYYAMAYVDGWPLTRWLSDRKPIALRQAANLIRKLAIAMGHAHRQKIVHRDLKPANVMIDRRGEPIIMDFGLARHETIDTRLTQSNMVVGTPAYLAPELIAGKEDCPATDVYALGVVLFELLTKRLPFSGHLGELLAQITRDAAPAPSQFRAEVTPALDEICRRALSKNSAERFATMEEMAEALSAAFRVSSEPATSVAWPALPRDVAAPLGRRIARRSVPWRLLVSTAVGGSAALGLLAWLALRPSDDSQLPSSQHDDRKPSIAAAEGAAVPDAEVVTPADTSTAQDDLPTAKEAFTPTEIPADSAPAIPAAPLPTQLVPRAASPLPVTRSSEPLRPDAAPRMIVTIADRMTSELRRIGDERRRILQAMIAISARRNEDLPKVRTVAAGELASARRLGEAADAERQDYERRIAFLNQQKGSAEAIARRQIEREVETLVQGRAAVLLRLQQLELEVRGKLVELARIDEESQELARSIERLVVDAQLLIDQAFWTADPCQTLEPAVHESFIAIYSEWLKDNPEQVEILALRALAAVRAGRSDSGLRDAQRAYGLQSKSSLALATQGYAKFVRGQTAEGLSEMTRAARLAPQSPYAPFLRGLADRTRKNRAAALDDFAKSAALAPLSPWAKAEWARALLLGPAEKNPPTERAVELAAAAVETTRRESWFCLDIYAATLAAAERYDEALDAAQAAIELAPEQARAECEANLIVIRERRAAKSP